MIEEELLGVKQTSNPGFPFNERYATNRELFKDFSDMICKLATERMIKLLDTTEIVDDPLWFYQNGFSDLISPNEKNEPHPMRKVLAGRWRIFCCQTIVDQLVERVLYKQVTSAVKDLYPNSGAILGIGFSDEKVTEFAEMLISRSRKDCLQASDVAGWETSLGREWITNSAEMTISKNRNPEKSKRLFRAFRTHALKITNPLYVVPDRDQFVLWTRSQAGGMLSGSFLTSLFNSLSRVDVSYVAGAEEAWAAGDDCIEDIDIDNESHKKNYKDMGFTLRDLQSIDKDEIEFCSHKMFKDPTTNTWKASLTTWPKMLYKTLSKNITGEQYAAFRYELRNNDNCEKLISIVDKYGIFTDN